MCLSITRTELKSSVSRTIKVMSRFPMMTCSVMASVSPSSTSCFPKIVIIFCWSGRSTIPCSSTI